MKAKYDNLRHIAETRLKNKAKGTILLLSEADKLKLIHELEVHQIELEMQNEELILARLAAQNACDKYTELYDFAPFGYFTVSREGEIVELNLSGSKMLGKDRDRLKNRMFTLFISKDSVPVFNNYLQKVFTSAIQERCELTLSGNENSPLYVQLNGFIPENAEYCWISMVDITEKKLIQNKILNAILMAEEREKTNFSTELHESLGPLMSTIMLYLSSIDQEGLTKKQQSFISMSKDLLNEAILSVKGISGRLSPHVLVQFGLTAALREFITKLNELSDFRIKFGSNLERRLDSDLEITLFRAATEFINSSVKFANAKNIIITLVDAGNQISLKYKDDGIGFDLVELFKTKKDLGLTNIENRIKTFNGKFLMESQPGHGVNYEIIIKF
jgi:PAS domain S-box-containing protein